MVLTLVDLGIEKSDIRDADFMGSPQTAPLVSTKEMFPAVERALRKFQFEVR